MLPTRRDYLYLEMSDQASDHVLHTLHLCISMYRHIVLILVLILPPGRPIGEALCDCGHELPMRRLTLTTTMGSEKETEQFCGIPLLQRRVIILELG